MNSEKTKKFRYIHFGNLMESGVETSFAAIWYIKFKIDKVFTVRIVKKYRKEEKKKLRTNQR